MKTYMGKEAHLNFIPKNQQDWLRLVSGIAVRIISGECSGCRIPSHSNPFNHSFPQPPSLSHLATLQTILNIYVHSISISNILLIHKLIFITLCIYIRTHRGRSAVQVLKLDRCSTSKPPRLGA